MRKGVISNTINPSAGARKEYQTVFISAGKKWDAPWFPLNSCTRPGPLGLSPCTYSLPGINSIGSTQSPCRDRGRSGVTVVCPQANTGAARRRKIKPFFFIAPEFCCSYRPPEAQVRNCSYLFPVQTIFPRPDKKQADENSTHFQRMGIAGKAIATLVMGERGYQHGKAQPDAKRPKAPAHQDEKATQKFGESSQRSPKGRAEIDPEYVHGGSQTGPHFQAAGYFRVTVHHKGQAYHHTQHKQADVFVFS